jgi:signal transduction histidine kinase
LQTAARAHRVLLRPQRREPIFGPLLRDLRRAEALLRAPELSPAALLQVQRVDERLRELHSERLGALLRLGPRTRVDAALVAEWIRAVEAELRVRAQPWISPVLLLEGMELEFPIEKTALMTLFFNLLRNAQAAVAAQPVGASVLVRVGEERDATGRRLMVLLVGDSSPAELSIEAIERRESGRGLAILRDLVHEWRGHLVVRAESAPWKKGVGACFPA